MTGNDPETVHPLCRPVTGLRGVAARLAARLERLGVRTVQDLLFHLPLRYEDRTRHVPIGGLQPGIEALVRGRVDLAEIVQGRRRRLLCRISDGTGALTLVFFHFHPAQLKRLRQGTCVACYGEARRGLDTLEMIHPEIQLQGGSAGEITEEETLTPVYPTTEGVNQTTLRRLLAQALTLARSDLPDPLQPHLPKEFSLPGLLGALTTLHAPPAGTDVEALTGGWHPAVQRLALEELLAHHLSLRKLRVDARRRTRAPVLRGTGQLVARFLQALPFRLTTAQQRVDRQIAADMASAAPMMRLVQGDVGSGKTVVAALATLRSVESGLQAAVMAPTELLAEQHYRNFRDWLAPLGVEVAWLSGRQAARTRRMMLERIGGGDSGVVVGTHALFQEQVEFHRLGLVVVDEQHRFGVHQRLALREKGQSETAQPHQLIMTATPIPRTLAMTAYADLDVSVIDELPPGRTPVTTAAVPDVRRGEVVAAVKRACAEGRQAYWVCTLIEESDALQAQAAEETATLLTETLPQVTVGLVHGRMKPADKEAVMDAFACGRTQLLVATTVIEVGVDVPNASLMIIENPERLGLAQLHQLRGRVGRGSAASSCLLLYHPPLSEAARKRLGVLRRTSDGFEIARQDLEIRGPGELLGTRQTGAWAFRVTDLARDAAQLPRVQELADILLREAPQVAEALIHRWVGEARRYGRV